MKTNTIMLAALVAATAAVPALAAGPQLDKAVHVAATKAAAPAIVEATVKAAQEDAAAATSVFKSIIGQRASWSHSDVYNIYNAVLMGSNLKASFTKDLESYTKGINRQDEGVKLLTALNEACTKLPNGTFEAVVGQLVRDANGVAAMAEDTAFNQKGVNTNGPAGICNTPRRDGRPNPAPVTPDPISPQN